MRKKLTRSQKIRIVAAFGVSAVVASIAIPNHLHTRARGSYGQCQGNIKNLGTAMEMYSTDWSGRLPPSISQLYPNYMKYTPECRANGEGSYKAVFGPGVGYNRKKSKGEPHQEYFLIWCDGDGHKAVGVAPNFPQYDGFMGILTRPPTSLGAPVLQTPGG